MTIPSESRGKRRKRRPQSSTLKPMLTSRASRSSKDGSYKSLWQVSQEELRRCCQQKHRPQSGQIVPGREQPVISHLFSSSSCSISFLSARMCRNVLFSRRLLSLVHSHISRSFISYCASF